MNNSPRRQAPMSQEGQSISAMFDGAVAIMGNDEFMRKVHQELDRREPTAAQLCTLRNKLCDLAWEQERKENNWWKSK